MAERKLMIEWKIKKIQKEKKKADSLNKFYYLINDI